MNIYHPIFIFLIFNKTPTAHSMAAHGMDLLLQNDGALALLLACFTQHDANRRLGAVCRALHTACAWQHVRWVPFTCIEAALERLRERYQLGPALAYYECLEAFTHTLYALQLSRAVRFCLASVCLANPTDHGRCILGFYSIEALDTEAWLEEIINVVRTHPAFRDAAAGPYAYQPHDPPWAAYVCLRDLGLRPVIASRIEQPPALRLTRNWIRYATWVYRYDDMHRDNLRLLRRLRADALDALD
jgi:hypothetical protein